MNRKISIALHVAAVFLLGISSGAAFAEPCHAERLAMEGADLNATAICSGPPTEEQLRACYYAYGVYSVMANQYQQCMAYEHQGPL